MKNVLLSSVVLFVLISWPLPRRDISRNPIGAPVDPEILRYRSQETRYTDKTKIPAHPRVRNLWGRERERPKDRERDDEGGGRGESGIK